MKDNISPFAVDAGEKEGGSQTLGGNDGWGIFCVVGTWTRFTSSQGT